MKNALTELWRQLANPNDYEDCACTLLLPVVTAVVKNIGADERTCVTGG